MVGVTPAERRRTAQDVARLALEVVGDLDGFESSLSDARSGLRSAVWDDMPRAKSDRPVSSVEREALRRGKVSCSDVDRRLWRLLDQLRELSGLVGGVAAEAVPAAVTAPKRCEVTGDLPVFRVGDVGGRLPAGLALGRWAYDWVVRTGALPSERVASRKGRGWCPSDLAMRVAVEMSGAGLD